MMQDTDSAAVREMALAARAASYRTAAATEAAKNAALERIAAGLEAQREPILAANREDLEQAAAAGVAAPLVQRLALEKKFAGTVAGVRDLIRLSDPVGAVQWRRQLDEGMVLERVSVPIGVLGIVFESRPDALVQIATLCLKSGNAVILKGGSEAQRTNAALYAVIRDALAEDPALAGAVHLAATRGEIQALLALDELVDLLIPRGSNELVRSIRNATRIPVLGHADGVCHVYVDAAADPAMATRIVRDAKAQYPAVCNAAETLLVHRAVAARFLPPAAAELRGAGVELRGDPAACALIDARPCTAADWDAEYLDLVLAIKVVEDLDEAIRFINRHGSHHTDTIVTADPAAAHAFLARVDSATVLWNASTRFADGFRFGMGAEVGISTNRIHARGPVGLDGLVTYKYRVLGSGQIVADYVNGTRAFHFAELADGVAVPGAAPVAAS
jgi:glutamate-5-semialdehyde dehydrogenase